MARSPFQQLNRWATVRDMVDTIIATNVVKRYGTLTAVDDVSFSVGQGEFFGILGPNGAGKTTLLEMIEGLRRARLRHDRRCSASRSGRATPSCCTGSACSCRPRRSSSGSPPASSCSTFASLYGDRRAAGSTRCWRWSALTDKAEHPGREAVRRAGAAAVHRLRADPRPGDRLPGRAVGGARPAGQAQPLGRAAGDQRPRQDRRADHPLHGRGRDRSATGWRSWTTARSCSWARRPSWSARLDAPVRISVEAGALPVESARSIDGRRRGQRRQGLHRHRHPPPVAGAGRARRGRRAGGPAGPRRDPRGRLPATSPDGSTGHEGLFQPVDGDAQGLLPGQAERLFFSILFPLFFIVIFGTVFAAAVAARAEGDRGRRGAADRHAAARRPRRALDRGGRTRAGHRRWMRAGAGAEGRRRRRR